MTFSRRTRHDPAPNALARAARGRPLLDLTQSDPTRAGLPYDAEAILGALADARALVHEPAPFGLPAAREAVAAELGADPARVVLTASTSEAYGYLFKLLCDPGDEVLVPQPSYPLFEHLATLDGVRPVPYPLRYCGRWEVDLDAVVVGPRTRALLVVNPNNPTGSYLRRDELAALRALGLPIVSDQVFARYPLVDDPARVDDLLSDEAPVFTLGGLSKLAGLPQLKVGWIAVGGPPRWAEAALSRLELVADTYLSVGAPAQHALPALLRAGRLTAQAIRERTRRNLAHLRAAVRGPVSLLRAEGGWSAVLQIPRVLSEEDWTLTLVERDAVLVHPGHFFDFESEAFLVVSLLTPEADFDEGIARLVGRVCSVAQ